MVWNQIKLPRAARAAGGARGGAGRGANRRILTPVSGATMLSSLTQPAVAAPRRGAAARRAARPCVAMSSAAASDVPDMGKRTTMNLLLLGALGLPGLPLAGGFAYFVRARAGSAACVLTPYSAPVRAPQVRPTQPV